MTTTMNPNRVQAGVREGGQFATDPKSESGVTLSSPATPSVEQHYVYIERQYSADIAIGPYPTAEAAKLACDEALIVTSFVEEDALECWSDDGRTLAENLDSFEQVGIDLNDPEYTGAPAMEVDGENLHIAAPDRVVRIDDPEDAFSPPLYEGPAAGAAQVLEPGVYRATDDDDVFTACAVVVP